MQTSGITHTGLMGIQKLNSAQVSLSAYKKTSPQSPTISYRQMLAFSLKHVFFCNNLTLIITNTKHEIKYAIWLYNTYRRHFSCNYLELVRAHELENFKLIKWVYQQQAL